MVATKGDKLFVHIGIGGAGNVVVDTRRPSHMTDPQPLRQDLGSRRYSTGIGGSGNIAMANQLEKQNEVEETVRLLYDMQAPGIARREESHYTGGLGHKHHPTEAEIEETRQTNDNVHLQSIDSINKRRNGPAARVHDIPSWSRTSRRMSVTDSMRDLFKARRSGKA
ncbi:hypothetical protein PV08_01296 [Exophiala spinifera]|uniref:Uncharacterized protein n=1 Tax=Exophiala spinifera TaxID=91928 RepID=A0A0D2CAW7_9EURO|nr:uncharacterized protein PV08_01296 [Exophiala spinifera]KIW20719.1 hypothetical protein PV08_01296 [Exophiala spinifera]